MQYHNVVARQMLQQAARERCNRRVAHVVPGEKPEAARVLHHRPGKGSVRAVEHKDVEDVHAIPRSSE